MVSAEYICYGNNLITPFMGKQVCEYHIPDWNSIMDVIDKLQSMGYSLSTTPWTIECFEYLSGDENLIANVEYGSPTTTKEAYFTIIVQIIEYINGLNL